MKKEILVCGVDCNPGDGYCNNYCNEDKSKPMADCPPEAPDWIVMRRLVKRAKDACDKADNAVEEAILAHNELFAKGIISGLEKLAESCKNRRERINLISGNKDKK